MALSHLIPWNRDPELPSLRAQGDPFGSLRHEMDRVFQDFARGFEPAPWPGFSGAAGAFHPSLDVRETDDEIRVTADLPGLEEKDVEVQLTGDVLTLRGEKRSEHEEKGELTHRLERSYGSFQRTVPLPCEVEAEKAKASFKQGVLTVTLPKAASARRNVRHVEITTSS